MCSESLVSDLQQPHRKARWDDDQDDPPTPSYIHIVSTGWGRVQMNARREGTENIYDRINACHEDCITTNPPGLYEQMSVSIF